MKRYLSATSLRWLLSVVLLLLVSSSFSQDRRFLLDLGNPSFPTNDAGWNNMTSAETGTVLNNMITSSGSASTVGFEIVKNAYNGYGTGGYNDVGYNAVVGDYPASACRDSYFAYGVGGIYKLKGLTTYKFYTIKLFCSRASSTNDRVGSYIVNGTRYTFNSENNTNQFVTFYHVRPTSSGEITLDFNVAENSLFAYINVVDVTEFTTPQITAPTSLVLQNQTSGVALGWTDQSSNETGFRVERKLPSEKYYTQVAQVGAGVTQYTDATTLTGTTYEYRVYAYNATLNSAFSNTLTLTTAGAAPDRRYLIDFGSPATGYPTNLPGWNNMTSGLAGATLSNLKDANGNPSDLGLQIVTVASNGYGDGTVYNTDGYNATGVLDYPATATRDSYFSYGAGGTYKLTGLNVNRFYNIRIFGSRTASASDRVGKYVVDGAQRVLNAASNSSQTVIFYNVIPNASGEIILDFGVADNAALGYMNVLDILDHSVSGINKPTQLSVQLESRYTKLVWTDNASNETGFIVERKSNLETAYKEIATTAAGVTQYTDGLLNNGLDYTYRITAYNATERSPYSNAVTVSTPGQQDRRFLMDFGSPSFLTTTAGWNNMTGAQTGAVLNNMIDSKGVTSGVGFEIVQNASNGYGDGTPYNTNGYNGTLLDYPLNACRDSYFSYAAGGKYKFKGLNPNYYYNITIFGSRAISDNVRVGKYVINGEKKTLNAASNTSTTITFRQVKPSSAGEILLDFGVETGSTLGYINVIDFTEVSVPEGNPPLIQNAQVIAGGVKLDWQDNSKFESGYEIYRATGSQTSIYSLLSTTAANVTTYTDASASTTETYFYRVRALFSNGASPYSNSVISNNATPPTFATAIGTQQLSSGSSGEVTVQAQGAGGIPMDRKKIVILGSSTAEGFGATTYANSWAGLYTQYLSQFDPTLEVINLGKFGYTTRDVLPTGDADRNITKALTYNPLMIIVNLPTNDVANGITSTEMMDNLSAIKQLGENAGTKVYITTTMPRNFTDVNQRTDLQTRATTIMSTFGSDAIQLFSLVADANLNIQSQYMYDAAHVNNAGHALLYDAIKTRTTLFLNKTQFTFSLTNAPYFVSLSTLTASTCKLTIAPDSRANGVYNNVTLTATDKNGNYVNQNFTIKIENAVSTILDQLAFQYKYDGRKRMIKKKVPGADWVYMVYDDRDRLVLTQDGNQRSKATPEWTFTKYDALNRPVMTGIYKDNETRSPDYIQESMQQDVNDFYQAAANNTDEWCEVRGTAVHGYTNQSFPKVSEGDDYLTVTYYDDYSFASLLSSPSLYNYDPNQLPASGDDQAQEATQSTRVIGQVTASKVKVLGTSQWLWSVSYFDEKYRPIQSIADNHKGGRDKTTNVYDFVGKVLRTKTEHLISGASARSITRKFKYDHAGRLMKTWHSTNGAAFVLLSMNEYNEIGQLVTKKLYNTDAETAPDNQRTFKQSVDYRYNIRGWLEKVNDVSAPETSDLFSMNLNYNTPTSNGGAAQYNGNISEILWRGPDARTSSYGYSYDPMNRLVEAKYYNATDPTRNGRFNEKIWDESTNSSGYDLNGNIKFLSRSGKTGVDALGITTYGAMDKLAYSYRGNQLLKVTDTDVKTEGFIDGANIGDDYSYDVNGNMKVDQNKSITGEAIVSGTDNSVITYNYLNLVDKVVKSNGEYLTYTYDATGRKLRQQVFNASNAVQKTSDYVGEYFYESNDANGNELKFINHEEGRIVVSPATEYQYHLKDHLGNVRVTFTTKQETETSKATLESAARTDEGSKFLRYDRVRIVNSSPLFDHTNDPATGSCIRLSGGELEKTGLVRSISVMPGDVINMKVFAKYLDRDQANWEAALLPLVSPIMSGTTGVVIDGGLYGTNATNAFPYTGLNNTGNSIGNGPKAYLNYIMFDRDYNVILPTEDPSQTNFVRVPESAKETGANLAVNPNGVPHALLSASVTVKEAGYMYIYLSNEEPTPVEVYFDDFEVEQIKSPVVQQDEYYPFGLAFNSYSRENNTPNKFKFNGIEEDDELGLNVLHAVFRMNDPSIGRWWQIDPKAVEWESPYSAIGNNPISNIDPLGDTTTIYNMEGKMIGSPINDGLPNQAHFVSSSIVRNENESDDDYATRVRAGSSAFMGANTGLDMQMITEMSNNLGVEVGIVGVVGEDREIRLGALTPDGANTANGITIAGFKDQMSKSGLSSSGIFMWGHTHPEKGFEVNYANNPLMLNTDPVNREKITSSPSGYIFANQGPKDYYQMLGRTTPAMVLTSKSVSIYSSNGSAGGDFNTHKIKSFRSK